MHKQDNQRTNKHNISSQQKQGEDGRVLPRKLLDNGQGKSTTNSDDDREGGSDMDISTEDSTDRAVPLTDRTDMDTGGNSSLLHPPIIEATGKIATGATTPQLHKQNRLHHQETLLQQPISSHWQRHQGNTFLDEEHWDQCTKTATEREMAPQGLALKHEAAAILKDWEQFGCPTATGRDWTTEEIQAAIDRGPHKSALKPEAIKHFAAEVADKVAKGQARVVLWDEIKDNHPRQLKISPVAAIPYKSGAYRSILNLSFNLQLEDGGIVQSVNDTTQKLAPCGAIGQLGHSLKPIIHAFAEAEDNAVVLMAK